MYIVAMWRGGWVGGCPREYASFLKISLLLQKSCGSVVGWQCARVPYGDEARQLDLTQAVWQDGGVSWLATFHFFNIFVVSE